MPTMQEMYDELVGGEEAGLKKEAADGEETDDSGGDDSGGDDEASPEVQEYVSARLADGASEEEIISELATAENETSEEEEDDEGEEDEESADSDGEDGEAVLASFYQAGREQALSDAMSKTASDGDDNSEQLEYLAGRAAAAGYTDGVSEIEKVAGKGKTLSLARRAERALGIVRKGKGKKAKKTWKAGRMHPGMAAGLAGVGAGGAGMYAGRKTAAFAGFDEDELDEIIKEAAKAKSAKKVVRKAKSVWERLGRAAGFQTKGKGKAAKRTWKASRIHPGMAAGLAGAGAGGAGMYAGRKTAALARNILERVAEEE